MSAPRELREKVNRAMDALRNDLGSVNGFTEELAESRYGFRTAGTIQHCGENSPLVVVVLNPGAGTGNQELDPETKKIGGYFPRTHPDHTHEWVFAAEADKVHRYSRNHDNARTPETMLGNFFASFKTRYTCGSYLWSNPKDPWSGITIRDDDEHALVNPTTEPLVLIAHAAQVGVPLTDFEKALIKRTGGVNAYLLNLDTETGRRLD